MKRLILKCTFCSEDPLLTFTCISKFHIMQLLALMFKESSFYWWQKIVVMVLLKDKGNERLILCTVSSSAHSVKNIYNIQWCIINFLHIFSLLYHSWVLMHIFIGLDCSVGLNYYQILFSFHSFSTGQSSRERSIHYPKSFLVSFDMIFLFFIHLFQTNLHLWHQTSGSDWSLLNSITKDGWDCKYDSVHFHAPLYPTTGPEQKVKAALGLF